MSDPTPSVPTPQTEDHQCDGEFTWCDRCEAREKARGPEPSHPADGPAEADRCTFCAQPRDRPALT